MRWALGSKKYLVYTLTFPLFTGLGWAAGNSPTASGDRSVGGIIGFTAFFAISGFAIAYCAAAYALNICEIRADRTCITYSSGPFRWFRPKSFDESGLASSLQKSRFVAQACLSRMRSTSLMLKAMLSYFAVTCPAPSQCTKPYMNCLTSMVWRTWKYTVRPISRIILGSEPANLQTKKERRI